jgi:HEAT repeat protein
LKQNEFQQLVKNAIDLPDDKLPEVIAEAERWLHDEKPERRKAGLDALGYVAEFRSYVPSADVIARMIALADDDYPGVRAEAAIAMALVSQIPDAERSRVLLMLLQDEELMVREEAAASIGDAKLKNAAGALYQAMESASSESLKLECTIALGALRDPRAVGPLIGVLAKRSTWDRVLACEALGEIGDRTAVPPLTRLAKGWFVPFQERLHALAALARLGEEWADEKLRSRMKAWSRVERELAINLVEGLSGQLKK